MIPLQTIKEHVFSPLFNLACFSIYCQTIFYVGHPIDCEDKLLQKKEEHYLIIY